MPKSVRDFNRWTAHDPSTWVFQIFKKYNTELYQIIGAHSMASAFAYRSLKKAGAEWTDAPSLHFDTDKVDIENYSSLKKWSSSYNLFDNWANISSVMTLSSNLETYLSSVISLAIDSDPGVLLGAYRTIDGAAVLKHRKIKPAHLSAHVEACTKGDWSKRLSAFEALFGPCPKEMRSLHTEMEEIRAIRNRFGHAFGRDIQASRQHGTLEIAPMENVSRKTSARLGRAAWNLARTVDQFLLKNHIGDFEAAYFYQTLYSGLPKEVHINERAMIFKKTIGRFGAGLRGKKYCKELAAYWEAL